MSFARATLLATTLLATAAFAARQPDGLITSKAKLALWTTAGVRSTTVHVDTNDGVITLYGKVPTAAMRAKAQKTAGAIAGVVRVQNLLQIVPAAQEEITTLTDRDTRALAEQALRGAELKDSTITVKSVDKGVLILTGEAKTYSTHLRAISIVDRVEGVKRIVSEVKMPRDFREDDRVVFLGTGAKPIESLEGSSGAWDGRISVAVKMRLLTASEVPSNEIRVDTEEGVVTLFGIVPTAAIKTEAGSQASRVEGVIRVDNHLEVVPTAMKKAVEAKDDDISRDLALAFKARPELKAVTSTVKNGSVQLAGKVPNGWERLHALRVTRAVRGVRVVEDLLDVTDEQRPN